MHHLVLKGTMCCPYRAMDILGSGTGGVAPGYGVSALTGQWTFLGLEPGALPPATVFQPLQAEENLGHVLQRKLMSKEKWQTNYLEPLFVIT